MDSRQNPASICGLYCSACTVFIGTHEDPARLKAIAEKMGTSVDDMACEGCRSEKRAIHCRPCEFLSCAEHRGVSFCGECAEYPCQALRDFQAKMPHRLELWDAHQRIREVGPAVWCQEMAVRYACKSCGAINSAYDLSCRACGHRPGNDFVATHQETIVRHWTQNKPGPSNQ